jgi:DNA repair exonuclease SbcCD ATPase subunit
MVVGRNGTGKSFFMNLPKILYYGKLDNFKKTEIANRINLHAWIKGIDEISPTTTVTIERGFSPSDLKVFKYGLGEEPNESNDIGKSGIVNYQDYIDLEVTGLPYHIFSNIISLSVNDFKSFISMTPNDKRIIIDKLFAMEIINKMNELIKKDLRDIKTNMDLFDREMLSLKANIDVAVNELQKLKDKVTEDNTSKILQLSQQLEQYKPKLQEGYNKKREWEAKRDEINEAYKIFTQQKLKLQHEIKDLNKQMDLFNQEKCPTCATPFNDTRFDLIKEQLQIDIKTKNEKIENVNADESKYTNALNKINQGLITINNFIIQIQTTYNTLESEMKKLKIDKPKEFASIQNIISENTIKITSVNEEKVKIDEDFKYLIILEQLYSDTGAKKKILTYYLPTLNKEIAYTLHELHFPYSLIFNSEFEPELQHLGIEIGVDTLSTSEKKSIDLAVLISIIRMLKRKYPSLNIFMLDEVLSSLDNDKIFDVLGVLKNTSKEMNMNIFIMNHSDLPPEHFSWKIEINKDDGFSDMKIIDLEN